MKRSHPDSLDYSVDSQDGAHDQVEDEVNEKRRKRGSEKKRRDRFNDLLSQLQELIPSASEKKEARKLEKAELLEMAVEYMRNKVLLSKGLPSSSCAESAGQSAIEKHGHTDRFFYRNRSVWNKTPQSKKAKGEEKTGGIHFPFMHEVQPRPLQSGFIPFVSGVHTPLGAPHHLLLRSFPAVLQSQSGDIVVREVLEKNFEMRRCCDL